MIAHSIAPHRVEVVQSKITYLPATTPKPRLGKFEYAQFLSRLVIAKGDLIINAFIEDQYIDGISEKAIFVVKDIQEIHHLVEYEESNSVMQTAPAPKCLLVHNSNGAEFWTIPSRWKLAPNSLLTKHGYANSQN
jgi:hypothetical protein